MAAPRDRLFCQASKCTITHSSHSVLDSKTENSDANFPAYNNRQKTGFFGCMPPESGFTVFSSWLFDAYYPQDEFNQAGRAKLAQKVSQIDLDMLLANEKTVTFAVVRHPMTRFVSSWVNGLFIENYEH